MVLCHDANQINPFIYKHVQKIVWESHVEIRNWVQLHPPTSIIHSSEELAWVLWISEVSVAILSPEATDSTRKSWTSIE